MTDHETMKLALDALKNGIRVRAGEGGTKYQPDLEDAAITALEAALAQPEQVVRGGPALYTPINKDSKHD